MSEEKKVGDFSVNPEGNADSLKASDDSSKCANTEKGDFAPTDMDKEVDLEVASSLPMGVIINGMEFEGHAVEPRMDCPHQKGSVNPIPENLDIFGPCAECGSTGENWLCLSCQTLHCSRFVNGHMQEHGLNNLHMLVLSIADISVWCYGCDDYIDNKGLYDAKNFVHQAKFGSPIPFYYQDSDDD